MTDVVRIDAVRAPQRLLEGENDGHAIDGAAERPHAIGAPRPDLRRDVPEHAYAVGVEACGEQRVELGVVDEQRCARLSRTRLAHEPGVGERDWACAYCHFTKAERGQIAQIGEELHARSSERGSTHPERACAATGRANRVHRLNHLRGGTIA